MSENLRLYRKIGFLNTFYIKCINDIIDGIGPSIILRSKKKRSPSDGFTAHITLSVITLKKTTRKRCLSTTPSYKTFWIRA